MSNYLPGNIELDLSLGTLASRTGILFATNTVTERTRCTSIKMLYTYSGYTVADNQGPIMVGVAHSDYTLVEIEEWIEQSTSWAVGDLVAKEVSGRKIRKIGVFPISGVTAAVGQATVLNDGRPIRTRLNWMLNTGQGLSMWAYNMGTIAIGTTNPNVNFNGKANLFVK